MSAQRPLRVGLRSRCLVCGGRTVFIKHPRIVSLNTGLWVHVSALRRGLSTHQAVSQ